MLLFEHTERTERAGELGSSSLLEGHEARKLGRWSRRRVSKVVIPALPGVALQRLETARSLGSTTSAIESARPIAAGASIAAASPACATAPGMPHTTELA